MTGRIKSTVALFCLIAATAPARAQPEPIKVVVAEARMVEAASSITLVGTVNPVRRSRVASEIAGMVENMPVRQGDRVAEGGVLCKLNRDTLTHRLTEAKARLNALRARHEELVAGTRREELTRLKALFDETAAEYDRWKLEMDRIQQLYSERDSNEKEYYDTKADFVTAERRKVAARADYDLGVEGPRKEVIAYAAYEVAEQQAVVDRIESDLGKTIIRAPFDGYVATRNVEIGEWVPVGGQIVEMIDLSTVLVLVNVPEGAFPYLTVGHAARVQVDALQRSFDGRVKHLLRQADPRARTFPIEVELDNREGLLAGGMFARVTVKGGAEGSIIAVPKDAIVERGGVANVAKVIPGREGGMVAILMGVTVGVDAGDWITITSGNVQRGMRVVTRGNEHILPFPTPVLLVDEKGNPAPMPGGNAPIPAGNAPGPEKDGA